MNPIFVAGMRSVRSLFRPGVFVHLLWPTLFALLLWGGLVAVFWTPGVTALVALVQATPLVGAWTGDGTALRVVVQILLILTVLPLVYVTASFLVAVVAIPLMLDRLAATDYRELEARRGGSMFGSMANALVALLIFVCLLILSLPLWLIPGAGIVISVLLSAWLNQRCYAYDALMNHADRDEMRRITKERRGGMYAMGVGAAVLGFIPGLNLIVPALTGLLFVHYLLEALRVERARHVKTVFSAD